MKQKKVYQQLHMESILLSNKSELLAESTTESQASGSRAMAFSASLESFTNGGTAFQ